MNQDETACDPAADLAANPAANPVAASTTRPGVKLRQIAEADLPAIADLLSEGFPFRSPAYWSRGLMRHAARPRPAGTPAFGFCLDSQGELVGVILLLFSNVPAEGASDVRCNVSSWYVKPEFRSFGSLLITATTRDKNVTYFNITPAPHTWSTVEAQGFSVYCNGQMYGLLAARRPVASAKIMTFADEVAGLAAFENDLLQQHASFGCLSVVVRDEDGDHPFVFQRHRVNGIVPIDRLIYCRSIDDVLRYAGNLGRFLLREGGVLVRFDANARVPGMPGWYMEKRGRKYFKGLNAPQLGDLAFTEAAMFDA